MSKFNICLSLAVKTTTVTEESSSAVLLGCGRVGDTSTTVSRHGFQREPVYPAKRRGRFVRRRNLIGLPLIATSERTISANFGRWALAVGETLAPVKDVRSRLISEFRWRSDPPVWPERPSFFADDSAWWRDSALLAGVGPALAGLFPDSRPTVVMGTESRGSLLGPLVATHLGIGFAEVRKEAEHASDDDVWLSRRTPPEYRDRNLELAVRRSVLRNGDRVLFVDDWAASGGQALACQQLAHDADATWLGAAVLVDGLENSSDRRNLNLRAVLHLRDLGRR